MEETIIKEWQDLQDILKLAENNVKKDPNTTLTKARAYAEKITELLMLIEEVEMDERTSQVDKLKELEYLNIIEEPIPEIFHSIRQIGNEAVHNNYGESAMADKILSLINYLSTWFEEEYGPFEIIKNKKSSSIRSEFEIEQEFINQLSVNAIDGFSQWIYREDLRTEEQLWQNFKTKLQNNNLAALQGVMLSDEEFQRVKNELTFSNSYEASKWLAGEAGVAQVRIQRDDAKLGKVNLKVFWAAEEAGGHSSYEVVNQVVRERSSDMDRNRRTDVTLLINGLPMIHIELKNANDSYMAAYNQIKKYLKEDKFNGIFAMVQMFVVSNGIDTRYFAPAPYDKLNEKFLHTWVTKKNVPVNRLSEFTNEVLRIPQAHRMISQYTVIDDVHKNLILLRPYQIHAIKAISEASKIGKSGYVWHTTGSGKTLTSYKVARNLLRTSLDKTIFIVDRIDLDNQTNEAFDSYSANDISDIDNTDNIRDLEKKLFSEERNIVITTIQKLNFLFKKLRNKDQQTKIDKLKNLKIAFIVDECHRAISFDKQKEIKKFFPRSLWYGFTGTPIFKEQDKRSLSNHEVTTELMYGGCLHEYTVKNAIADGAVLGFKIVHNNALKKDEYEIFEQEQRKANPKITDEDINKEYNKLDGIQKDELIPNHYYEDDKFMMTVINDIINERSISLFNLRSGVGKTYAAILTTSSIAKAQRYYDLFMQVKKGESPLKIDERVKKLVPDFPKIAITYSVIEDKEAKEKDKNHENDMVRVLNDYNKEYNKNFKIDEITQYNRDVNNRLARKKALYQFREEQIDLVIVVDRLLTGFDAPCVSTLFIDRKPMRYASLIQAFSRTNRIYDANKLFGNIITYQQPNIFKEYVDEALKLYSNGGESDVVAPEWKEIKEKLDESIDELFSYTDNPDIVNIPNTYDISNDELNSLKKYARLYQNFDKNLAVAKTYSEYDTSNEDKKISVIAEDLEVYQGKYSNVIGYIQEYNKKKIEDTPIDDEEYLDVEYTLNQISENIIDNDYIIQLIQSLVNQSTHNLDKHKKEIEDYIHELSISNERLADIMLDLWNEIQEEPAKFANKNIYKILNDITIETINERLEDFAKKWHVSYDALKYVVYNWSVNKDENSNQIGEESLLESADFDDYKASVDIPIPKFKYKKQIKLDLNKMMNQELLALRQH